MRLCETLGISFDPYKPSTRYKRGWGHNCESSKEVKCSWTLSFQDTRNRNTELTFDLFDDDSPLTIGLDIQRHSVVDFSGTPPTLTIFREIDEQPRIIELYIRSTSVYNARAHALITPTMYTLMATTARSLRPRTLAKRLHRLTHAHPDEIIDLCARAGRSSKELEEEVRKISENCGICAQSGLPAPAKKISINHVNQAFNVEIQVDFMFCVIRQTRYAVLHIVDCGTGFSEGAITSDREARTITATLEIEWINRHGAPDSLSADDEFNIRETKRFLSGREIEFKARPVRRHNKTGIVERKNGVVKRVLEKLQLDNTSATDRIILSRAIFLSNCFTGSKVMSSFELAKGYAPSALGAPRRMVTEELLEAYTQQAATRALQRALKARVHSGLPRSAIKPGDDVLFFFRTTANNVPDEWRSAFVVKAHPHFVEVRRKERGPISRIAYEDLRMRPNSPLARELGEGLMEDYIDLTLGPSSNSDNDSTMETSGALMAVNEEHARKDMGYYTDGLMENPRMQGSQDLKSNEQQVLIGMQKVIGSRQVCAREMQFAPPWILGKAVEKERVDNWIKTYEEVAERDVPRDANIISSHTVYKIKEDEDGQRKLKARLVTHGNRDNLKDEIRKDCSNADLIVVRLLLSISLCLGFDLGVADIKGAFLQSGPIKRDIYVRPAPEFRTKRGVLWKLTKLPYGIVEAGRQWAMRIESWMLGAMRLSRVYGINQLFVDRDELGHITLLIAKLVDDLLVAGTQHTIAQFMRNLQMEFEVGKIRTGSKLAFAGCDILTDEDDNITLSMLSYMDRLVPIEISRARRRQREERTTDDEIRSYRSLAGTLMYLGSGVLPQAAFVTSRMQQELGGLRVKHLIDANAMLQEIRSMRPVIKYIKPVSVTDVSIISFSDASHGTNDQAYGQSGVISGLKFVSGFQSEPIFHALHWTSSKQRRVTYSSFGAEILACTEAEDRGFDMKQSYNNIFPYLGIQHHILVDSKALFDTITTLHECREFRLRKTVTMLRDAFEAGEWDKLTWIPGKRNVADALTKRSVEQSAQLNLMLEIGLWMIDDSKGICHDHKTWQ